MKDSSSFFLLFPSGFVSGIHYLPVSDIILNLSYVSYLYKILSL